jgi:hypothetical protein
MPVTKLIFGLRTSQVVTLKATGQPRPPAPDLLVTTSGQPDDAVIAYGEDAWTATLPPGDHIVRLETPGDSWFDGNVAFTLSAASLIVIHGDAASPKPMAWLGTNSVSNPKNPWPAPFASEPLPNQAWFSQKLQALNAALSATPERNAPDLQSLKRETAR